LVNPIDKSNLILNNIDINEEKNFLQEKYLTPFFKHLNQILNKSEILELIKKVISETETENIEKEIKNEEGIVNVILKQKIKNHMQKDVLSITIEDNQVLFITTYFESSFTINIPTSSFISYEIKNMFKTFLNHFQRMKKFSFNDNNEPISCDVVLNGFEKMQNHPSYVFEKLKEGDRRYSFVFKREGKSFPQNDVVMSFSCEEVNETDSFLVRVKLCNENESSFVEQSFLKNSLYDLVPVIESFWEEVFDRAVKIYAVHTEPDIKVFTED
jgi:hypothetical protein